MLLPRIIPCLLISKNDLVKTINFENPNYIGDPINAVKIFNEKKADELFLLEIDASVKKYEPNFQLIKNIARESRMPICYGGGIKNLEQAKKIFNFGIEKIALSSVIFDNLKIVSEISNFSGTNSTVIVLDIKKVNNEYSIFINNGKTKIDQNIFDLIKKLEDLGMGEIVINSIDRDGTMQGYDIDVVEKANKFLKAPIIASGGARDYQDMFDLIQKTKINAIASASIYHFKNQTPKLAKNFLKEKGIKIRE